jgi:hypothetical protein
MEHVLFDAGIEAAIGQMMPSPLHQKKIKAMVGLEQIWLMFVEHTPGCPDWPGMGFGRLRKKKPCRWMPLLPTLRNHDLETRGMERV